MDEEQLAIERTLAIQLSKALRDGHKTANECCKQAEAALDKGDWAQAGICLHDAEPHKILIETHPESTMRSALALSADQNPLVDTVARFNAASQRRRELAPTEPEPEPAAAAAAPPTPPADEAVAAHTEEQGLSSAMAQSVLAEPEAGPEEVEELIELYEDDYEGEEEGPATAAISRPSTGEAAPAAEAPRVTEPAAAVEDPPTPTVEEAAAAPEISQEEAAAPEPDPEPVHEPLVRELDTVRIQKYIEDGVLNSICYSVWDFAGQKQFYGLFHIFLTRYACYFVVFNMEKVLDEATREDALNFLQFWLEMIHLYAQDDDDSRAPVILVGTHKDKVSSPEQHRMIDDIILERFAQNETIFSQVHRDEGGANGGLCFFAVDNTRGQTDPAIERLREQVDSLVRSDGPGGSDGYVSMYVPMPWNAACDALRQISNEKPTLTWAEMRQLCWEQGIVAEAEVERMLSIFHKLGMLLFYNEPGLKDMIVLTPQWLIERIAYILRDWDVEGRHPTSILLIITIYGHITLDSPPLGIRPPKTASPNRSTPRSSRTSRKGSFTSTFARYSGTKRPLKPGRLSSGSWSDSGSSPEEEGSTSTWCPHASQAGAHRTRSTSWHSRRRNSAYHRCGATPAAGSRLRRRLRRRKAAAPFWTRRARRALGASKSTSMALTGTLSSLRVSFLGCSRTRRRGTSSLERTTTALTSLTTQRMTTRTTCCSPGTRRCSPLGILSTRIGQRDATVLSSCTLIQVRSASMWCSRET